MESVQDKMLSKIAAFKDKPFLIADFSDCGSYEAVKKEIQRLDKSGTIKRICRGIYFAPRYIASIKMYSTYELEDVAYTIARQNSWTICPSINQSMNMTGVSTQVPVKYIYLSSGPYKKYHIGNTDIEFKHASSRYVSDKYSSVTMLLIQSIRGLGKKRMDERNLRQLKRFCLQGDFNSILNQAKNTTSWIYEVIKRVGEEYV